MAERKFPVDPVLDDDLGQGVFEKPAGAVPLRELRDDGGVVEGIITVSNGKEMTSGGASPRMSHQMDARHDRRLTEHALDHHDVHCAMFWYVLVAGSPGLPAVRVVSPGAFSLALSYWKLTPIARRRPPRPHLALSAAREDTRKFSARSWSSLASSPACLIESPSGFRLF
ncbi:kinase-like domain [Diaporthe eres]|nr:kinase-like domain [Diaporthe eres]